MERPSAPPLEPGRRVTSPHRIPDRVTRRDSVTAPERSAYLERGSNILSKYESVGWRDAPEGNLPPNKNLLVGIRAGRVPAVVRMTRSHHVHALKDVLWRKLSPDEKRTGFFNMTVWGARRGRRRPEIIKNICCCRGRRRVIDGLFRSEITAFGENT
ncbi:hypothetical protein EVAR_57087_1 [Eumeta japonica]|uniref:Uncharacterized protein n=1 Tax=Eumeta variegata TaxID=151549 RepID=A0A4C1ZAP5_EUMVA|nr:hypothetical protein EVAR_57087_1 [Eumeta japonica]